MNYHMVILITIAVVAFALVASTVYIYSQDDLVNGGASITSNHPKNANTSNANSGTNTNSAANTNTNVITATANWPTYTNTLYHYTVKYPNGWSDENTADANPAMFADPVAVAQTADTELLQGSKIEIVVDQNITATIQDFAAGQDGEGTILSESNMTVADTTGLWRAVNGPLGYYNVIYAKNGTSIYRVIQYIPKTEDRGMYTAIYDQMLLNFDFIQ